MPNWCNNRVTVSGNAEDCTKVKKFFDSDEPFKEIYPTPDWSKTPLAEEDVEYLGRKRGEVGELPVLKEKMLGKSLVFPSTDAFDDRWYDWQINHWGTKWDIARDHVEWGDDDEDYFVIHFDTAWSPPEGICHRLRELFPDLSISWFYDEPGCEVAGYL